MIDNCRPRRWAVAVATALALVAVTVVAAIPADASHLRGALGEASYDPLAKTVTLRTTLLQRKGFGSYTFFAFPTITRVDRTTGAMTTVSRCTGQNTAGQLTTDTTSQPLFDIDTSVFVIDVSCVAFNPNFDYLFSQIGNNRIAGIRNTTNLTIEVEARIRVDGVHPSSVPVYHAGYMTNVPYDPTATFSTNMNAVASDGSGVTYSLMTDQTSAVGGYGATRIPCSSFNTSTGAFSIGSALCQGSEAYAAAFGGGTDLAPVFYALKVKATDLTGQWMTRDVLLAFASSTNTKPVISSGTGQRLVLVPGTTTTVTITATDVDVADRLDFATDGLPAWASLTKPNPHTNPSTATLTLQPPANASETAQITVSAFDDAAYPLSASLQFDVQVGAALLPPGSPNINSVSPADGSASVTFTAAVGGGVVDSYVAVMTAPDGTVVSASCAAPPAACTVSGLQNGTTYAVVVRASNVKGSAESPSASVTPAGPMPPALAVNPSSITLVQNAARATNILNVTNTGGTVLSWTWSPAPPTGLGFDSATGSLTGTPTVLQGAQRYTLSASNTLGTSSVSVDLAVASGYQTITFAQPWGMKVSSSTLSQNLTATSTSGLAVSFAVASGSTAGCTISGTQVRITSSAQTGTCTIMATQAGGNGYAAAAAVYRSFSVFSGSSTSTTCSTNTSTRTYSHPAWLVVSPTAASLTVGTAVASTPFAIVNAGAPGAIFSSGVATACPVSTSSSGGYKISPSLPAGLSLNVNTGAITGTPTTKQSATTYQLWAVTKATSGTLTATAVPVTIEVLGKPQTVTFNALADKALGNAPFAVSATASSGLTVSFQSFTTSVCTVSGTTVTIVAAGTCSITASQSGSSAWAAAGAVTRSFTVTSKPVLHLSTPAGSFTANTPVGSPYTISNTGGPAVSYAISPAAPDGTLFDPTTGLLAGAPEEGQDATPYAITATNAVGTSNPVTFTMTVVKAVQTITFDRPHGMVVGDAQTASATSDSGLPPSLTVTTPTVCHLVGTTLHADAAGTCSVTAAQAGDASFAPAASVNRSVTVATSLTRPQLTIDNTSATFAVGLPIFAPYEIVDIGGPATSYAIAPPLPVGFTFDPQSGAIADGTATAAGTTVYSITATNGAGTSDPVTFTLTIAKRTQTITFPTLSRMLLTTADQLLRATSDSGLAVTYQVAPASAGVCSIVAGRVRSLAGGPCTVDAVQAGDDTFAAAATASRSFVVLVPPAPSVTPSPVVLVAGTSVAGAYSIGNTGGDATFWSISPALPDGVTLDSATGALLGAPTTSVAAQTYTLTGSNDAGTGTPTTFSLRVDKHAQSVTFAPLNGAVLTQAGTLDQQLSAVADSALPVSYSVASGSTSVCTVTGDVVTAIAAGTCTVVASQSGDTAWAAATTASRSFTVFAALVAPNITLSSSSGSFVFGEDAGTPFVVTNAGGPASSFSISPSLPAGLGFDTTTGTVSGTPAATSAAVAYTVTASNASGSSTATYTMAIAKATASVTLSGLAVTYTGSSVAVTAVTEPAGLAVTFTYDGSYSAPTLVGSYTVVATVNDADHAGTATGTLVISPAPATVALSALSRTWTGAALSPTVTTTPSGLAVALTYDGSSTAPDRAGSYLVVASVTDANYAGVVTGTLVIAAVLPAAPVLDTVTPDDGALDVDFTPGTDGGSAVTTFEYALDGGAWSDGGTVTSPLTIEGLTNGESYVVQLRAVTPAGHSPASVGLIGQPYGAPVVASGAATAVTTSSAGLRGTVDANGAATTVVFAWGVTPGLPTDEHVVAADESPLALTDHGDVGATLTGLPEGTTIYVRLSATNAAGTRSGVVVSFTTAVTPPPTTTTTTVAPTTTTTEPPTTTTTEPPTTTTTVAPTTTTTVAPTTTTTVAPTTTTTAGGTTTTGVNPTTTTSTLPPSTTTTSTTVAPTTTTAATTTVPPSTTSVPVPQPRSDGVLPELPPGGGQVLDDAGNPHDVTVTASPGSVGLDAGTFGMTLSNGDTTGPAPAATGGLLTLEPGKTARVTGYGFEPASQVDVWLFSDPYYVGKTTVAADGTFDVTLPVPSDIDPGDHTLQANGHTYTGEIRSMNAGVRLLDRQGDLPTTGGSPARALRTALGLVLLGVVLVLLARRARRRPWAL